MDSLFQHLLKDFPSNFLARLGQRTAVNWFGTRPKAISLGIAEKLARFQIDTPALSAGNQREYEYEKPGKSEFSVSGKVFGGLLLGEVNSAGNNFEKFPAKSVTLA